MTASTAPAAPSVCPVMPLVELHGDAVPKTAVHRAVLGCVVARRAGAVQVHVVDVAPARAPPRRAPHCIARRAPSPSGCGADMWCASHDSPAPSRREASRVARPARARAGRTPRPRRSRCRRAPASYGRQGLRRQQLQRVEPVERGEAQRVDAAHDRGVDQRPPRSSAPPSRTPWRWTSTRSRPRWRGRAARAARARSRRRKGVVGVLVVEVRRQRAGRGSRRR